MKMRKEKLFKFILWTFLTFSSLYFGLGSLSLISFLLFCLYYNWLIFHLHIHTAGLDAKCEKYGPKLQQTRVSNTSPPKFMVEVYNSCPMCPLINIHLNCGNFPQSLVSPRLLKVLGHDDCVVNGGLPLQPLQKFSFNYSHPKYPFHPATWYFQCEWICFLLSFFISFK